MTVTLLHPITKLRLWNHITLLYVLTRQSCQMFYDQNAIIVFVVCQSPCWIDLTDKGQGQNRYWRSRVVQDVMRWPVSDNVFSVRSRSLQLEPHLAALSSVTRSPSVQGVITLAAIPLSDAKLDCSFANQQTRSLQPP